MIIYNTRTTAPSLTMDVRDTLKLHMNYIVGCFFSNVGGDEALVMDEMYKLIENDIDINFDSKHFYILGYEFMESSQLKFDIDPERTPKALLKMIIKMIELQRMEQNIKNKQFLIHFRGFVGKVYLEDKENTLRIEAFLQLHNYLRRPFNIRVYLIEKLLEIKNQLKQIMGTDNMSDECIRLKIHEYRIRAILRAIECRTSLLS